jgi:hypothetical protein
MPTPRLLAPLVVTFLIGIALAGCLGGDDFDDPGNGGDEPLHTESTGSIQGRVLTDALNPINNARVILVKDQEMVQETRADSQGRYTLSNVEPGDYRIQFSATCCAESVQVVRVDAGKATTLDVQMRAFTAADLQAPFVDPREWQGFLPCGAGLVVITLNPCALDENNDNVHYWNLPEGVQAIAIAMDWNPTGGALGKKLYITMESDDCPELDDVCYEYFRKSGEPPITMIVNSPGGDYAFEKVDGSQPVRFRVFGDFDPDVFYQQPFTVHYHLFFHQDVPEGYNPIPDF